VTTLFDLYGLPKDFPGLDEHQADKDTNRRCDALQATLGQEFDDPRFIPYLQRHEFEALVLASLPSLLGRATREARRRLLTRSAQIEQLHDPLDVALGVGRRFSTRRHPLASSPRRRHHPPMQTTAHGWRILDAEAGVLSLSYRFGGDGLSNCFTAKLPSGGLLVVSPPSRPTDGVFEDLADFGEVEALVANNGYHHMGIGRWRERYPDARCFAAPGASERIAKKSKDAGELEPLAALQGLLGDGVAVVEAPASKAGETWARAKIAGGWAWYASDILANMDQLPANFLFRTLFKLSKSAPGYRVFNLAVKFIIADKKVALGAMLADLRAHPPTVMVPAHGTILTTTSLAADTERLLVDAIG
jgi:hypothetical protein